MEVFASNGGWVNLGVQHHSDGYVLNVGKHSFSGYLRLNKTRCPSLVADKPPRGDYWTKDYIKACSGNTSELEVYAAQQYPQSDLHSCLRCRTSSN